MSFTVFHWSLRRVKSGAVSPALSVSLATCDFSACGAAGAAASAAATTSPRAIVCFIENPPSELGYEWQQELTPCHSSNTTGMPKIFHTPCAGEIEGASVVQAAHQGWQEVEGNPLCSEAASQRGVVWMGAGRRGKVGVQPSLSFRLYLSA